MSEVDLLQRAERQMLAQHGPEHPRHEMWVAMSAWIRQAAMDLWAHGLPSGCVSCGGCNECDDLLYASHVRRALAVARAYLTSPAPSESPREGETA